MLRTDSGRATRARRSARPSPPATPRSPSTSSVNSSSTALTVPSRSSSSRPRRNGRMKRRLNRICSSPSVVSMCDPKMSRMVDAGESVVKRSQSARTRRMSSRRVSSHIPSSGAHVTGSAVLSSWKRGYGSSASESMVTWDPSGNRTDLSVMACRQFSASEAVQHGCIAARMPGGFFHGLLDPIGRWWTGCRESRLHLTSCRAAAILGHRVPIASVPPGNSRHTVRNRALAAPLQHRQATSDPLRGSPPGLRRRLRSG